ncbi:MAG: hypothetical protein JW782_01090 [Candidatus Saganbacteria bacterium]|nr:hypothetical protein [Candidatus Saganbacteria bacterium]
MVNRVFYKNLSRIAPQTSGKKTHFSGLASFLRLNCEAAIKPWRRKEAILPDKDFSPVMVEVNQGLSAAELERGFLEWRQRGDSILANPLDRAQFRDLEEFSPEETLRRLESYAGRTYIVQSYPEGTFEAHAICNGTAHVFLMENAPWNNSDLTGGQKKLYGTASLIWEVLFENALLDDARLWKRDKVAFFREAVVATETWHRLQLACLRPSREQRQPSGREVLTGLLHYQIYRNMIYPDAPASLSALSERVCIPEDILSPFLGRLRGYYALLAKARYF